MMTMASEHAHDQVSKQTLKVVLLQLAVRLTGSVIQLVLIEVVVIGAARLNFGHILYYCSAVDEVQ